MNNVEIFKKSIDRGPYLLLIKERISDDKTAVILYKGEKFDIYQCAVYQAWLDMCRTLKTKNNKKWILARKILSERLKFYFDEKPKRKKDAFDGWYYSLNSDVRIAGKFTVGQAQKLINMSFKYLYCCGELRNEYREHFTYCHFPLDGFILHWYKLNVDKSYDGESWSKIDDIKKYETIVSNIRDYCKNEILIEKEFFIWESEKKTAKDKELLTCVDKIVHSPQCSPELRTLLEEYCTRLCK